MSDRKFNLWTVILTGVGMLFCFAAWSEMRFAPNEKVDRLASEVDALYLKLIPEAERK